MYGYVVPKKEKLETKDFVLYRAFYCGICKATGKSYGLLPRFTTNYDMVFLSLLMHDYISKEVSFETGGCVLNPLKKKATVARNDLLEKIVATNIILSYYKVSDDILDRDGHGKKLARRLLSKHYKKARQIVPKIDDIIKKRYEELYRLEEQNEQSLDKVSHCFSQLLLEIADELTEGKADDHALKLCYNIGKFVYLADALDDIGEDNKKKRYNPFLQGKKFINRKQFIFDNYEDIRFILSVTVNRAIECFNNINFTQSYNLLENIVHIGLRDKCEQLLQSVKKLPKPKI